MRKLVVGTLFVFVAVLCAAPAFGGTVLKFSSIHEPAHPSAYTADFFAQRVNQMTNGELDVQVYHSRQLGDARDNVENVRNGSIAFTSVSISNLSQVLPVMDVWSLPYVFKSDDHYWYVLNSGKDLSRTLLAGDPIVGTIPASNLTLAKEVLPVPTPTLTGSVPFAMASNQMVESKFLCMTTTRPWVIKTWVP